MPRRATSTVVGLLAGLMGLVAAAQSALAQTGPADPAGIEFFENRVRPLLVERCYKCHSAQADTLRGNLFLDTRAGWTKGGDTGPAIVPGDPEASLLVKAVRYDDDSVQMPPDGKLPDAEIATLLEWVERGAPDPREGDVTPIARKFVSVEEGRTRWAFQPLGEVTPPTVQDPAWGRTPIDQFILAKLEAAGLSPNPAADRRTLIRRASFDLIGLPPTPEEVEEFVNDPAPDAYDQLIDRLLKSPHHGERWGRHWLDLARFAESHGYEQDYDRPAAYHFRDFVIKALNDDLPYDTFVKWQIAGDEYAPDDPLALMATGYLAAGTHATQITKNQVEKERYDELDDMSATIGTSMLGLTIGCARCHDHKFDPIPTADYYRLLSSFTTAVRSEIDLNLDPEPYNKAKAAFDAEHAPLAAALDRYEREILPAALDSYLAARSSDSAAARWLALEPVTVHAQGGATFERRDDGSLLAGGANPEFDTYTFVAHTQLTGINAVRLEALGHESLAVGGPGRADNGNFAISDFRLTAAPLAGGDAVPVKLARPQATFEQEGLPIAAAIDEDPKSGWAVDPQLGKDHAAVFEPESPVGLEGGTVLTFTLKFETNAKHAIGRLRLSISTAPSPVAIQGETSPQNAAEIRAVLARAAAQLTDDNKPLLARWYRGLDPAWRRLRDSVESHLRQAPQPTLTKVMITSEGLPAIRNHTQGGDFLDHTHFLERGDPNRKGEIASQGFLQVLMNAPEREAHWQNSPPDGWRTSYRRRALAEWITDTDSGAGDLLARVIVNRLWQHHLGRGIVATPSDFGAQGPPPTHPELIDWLAGELVRGGWRLKPIHKLIMTSGVYMQTTDHDADRARLDIDNKFWWRREPARLEAEAIRDSLLAVGGTLDRTQFGPGSLDPNHKRRSIYFTIKRSQLVPMMMLFDSPDSLQSLAVRSSTTIAPQALMLMNHPLVRECARELAAGVDPGEGGDLAAAVRAAYYRALSRPPADDELVEGAAFIESQAAAYAAEGEPDARRLAIVDFCQVLFGLNEFIYIE